MAYVRRATDKDATWQRAWTADALADLTSLSAALLPRHGDIAFVTATGFWYAWFDDNTWLPFSSSSPSGAAAAYALLNFNDNDSSDSIIIPGPSGIQGLQGIQGIPGLDGESFSDYEIRTPPNIPISGGVTGQIFTSNGIDAPSFQNTITSGSRAYSSVTQTAIASTVLVLSFDTNVFNINGVHSTSVNPTRFTVPAIGTPGIWMLTGTWTMNGALGAANYIMQIRKNGAALIANTELDITVTSSLVQSIIVFDSPAASDYYEFLVFQNTALNRTIEAGIYQCTGSAVRLSN